MKVLTLILVGIALSNSDPVLLDPNNKIPFPIRFYLNVAAKQPTKNVVVSPASVTTCIALAYLGASGKTAEEFHDVLAFTGSTQMEIAKHYGDFVTDIQNKATKDLEFAMANRIFVDQGYELNPRYNELATQYFKSEAKNIDFTETEAAAIEINSWISQETHEQIKTVVKADDFDDSTAVILVNAVYFKAPWKNQFQKSLTHKNDFFLNKNDKLQVDMMQRIGSYEVADWTDIDATAVKIPYADTDIYMLILLPNNINGLVDMVEKFKAADHAFMQPTYNFEYIELLLPKFKLEFDISLVDVLAEMGLKSMFTDNADFSKLTKTNQPPKVSNVKHKAFIEVDENGTEAAGVTVAKFSSYSAIRNPRKSRKIAVDHPFMFAIKDHHNVYFAGHIVNL